MGVPAVGESAPAPIGTMHVVARQEDKQPLLAPGPQEMADRSTESQQGEGLLQGGYSTSC